MVQRFHKPDDEKHMLVIFRPDQYDDWLTCPVEETNTFYEWYPAERLMSHAAPKPAKAIAQPTLPDI